MPRSVFARAARRVPAARPRSLRRTLRQRPGPGGSVMAKAPSQAQAQGAGGEDSDGRAYGGVSELWSQELGSSAGRDGWYAKATSYWEDQEATVNGVLGGYPETSGPDLRESGRFLKLLRNAHLPPVFGTVLDCGAGIGRVTSGLLLPQFELVDLVEPNKRLLDTARSQLQGPKVGRFICSSLQDFEPEAHRYNVIWAQWVLLYLPDDDLVAFLDKCRSHLKPQGVICIKENVVLDGNWVVDREDNSIARTDEQYKSIFERAGLCMIGELRQTCWPPDLIPVKMYALRDIEPPLKKAALQKEPI